MELLTLKKIELKNTVRKLLDPFEFDLEMQCKEDIQEGVVFSVIYTVNVSNESEDQILSETEICPIPKGNVKFSLEADAPDLTKIPYEQLFGLTSIIIIGRYKDQQFMRVGYIVDVYYPGISNEKLLYNETEDDAEDIVEEDLEEEDEDNENFDDLIVEDDEEVEDVEEKDMGDNEEEDIDDNEEEDVEEEDIDDNEEEDIVNNDNEEEDIVQEIKNEKVEELNTPKTFSEAVQDNLKNDSINQSKDKDKVNESEFEEVNKNLNAPITEEDMDGDFFEFRGFKINQKKIEMNVMVPPSVHSFLIGWKEGQEESVEDMLEEENTKKMKINE